MFGFLIAIGAGFLVPQVETTIGKPVIAAFGKIIPIEAGEHRAIMMMVTFLIVGLIAAIFDSGNVLGMSLGFLLGYFGLRIFTRIKNGKA